MGGPTASDRLSVSGAGAGVSAELAAPPDKSCSHRALMLASVAEGTTHIRNLLEAEDVMATRDCLEACGAKIERLSPGEYRVTGVERLHSPAQPLDFANAGTGVRLMLGLLAGQGVEAELIGDASLSQRPMRRVAGPLADMGASIETSDGCLPLHLSRSEKPLAARNFDLAIASSQIKSCLLLAGLRAQGITRVSTPTMTRDHTERMLRVFGVDVHSSEDGKAVEMSGGQSLRAPT